MIGETYDVTCVKMPQNEHTYLAFPLVNVFESLFPSRQRLYLSNSIFSKHSIQQIILNVTKYHFLTLEEIWPIKLLENKEYKGSSRYLKI